MAIGKGRQFGTERKFITWTIEYNFVFELPDSKRRRSMFISGRFYGSIKLRWQIVKQLYLQIVYWMDKNWAWYANCNFIVYLDRKDRKAFFHSHGNQLIGVDISQNIITCIKKIHVLKVS